MAIVMLVTCSKCGAEYEPPKTAIIAGIWMRACPRCYPLEPPKKAA